MISLTPYLTLDNFTQSSDGQEQTEDNVTNTWLWSPWGQGLRVFWELATKYQPKPWLTPNRILFVNRVNPINHNFKITIQIGCENF